MPNQHVVPNGDKWSLKAEGAERATKNFNTQREAIQFGRDLARRQESELVIHNRSGQIRDKDSYGHDPFPPRDTKF